MFNNVFANVIRADGAAKESMIANCAGTISNNYLGRNAIISAFIDNGEVVAYGHVFVFASIIIGPFYGLYQLCQTFLQSTGKASYASLVALMDKGLFYLPLLFILGRAFGLYGIIFTGAVTLFLSLAAGIVFSLIWNRKISASAG